MKNRVIPFDQLPALMRPGPRRRDRDDDDRWMREVIDEADLYRRERIRRFACQSARLALREQHGLPDAFVLSLDDRGHVLRIAWRRSRGFIVLADHRIHTGWRMRLQLLQVFCTFSYLSSRMDLWICNAVEYVFRQQLDRTRTPRAARRRRAPARAAA